MRKRAVAVFLLFFVLIFGAGVRVAELMLIMHPVAGSVSGKRIDLATVRGTVYDCKLNPLTNSEYDFYAAAKPTVKALEELKKSLDANAVLIIKERMEKKNPIVVKTDSALTDCSDIISVAIPKRYMSDSLACHIIGYVDSSGQGISGVEKVFNSVLTETSKEIYARFSTDAHGNVLLGEQIELSDLSAPEGGVVLTIDKDIQSIVEKALDESGSECAAAIVTEIKNGAVRACVSRPLYNQNDVAASLDNPDSPLINRAFMPFSVGSVFKPVVTAAALESGVSEDFEYNCTGSVVLNGVTFNCHKKDGHGVIDMKQAVANSCNTYFIELAMKTGADAVLDTAKKSGFGTETVLNENIISDSGNLPLRSEIDSKAALANLSFGQGSLTATPVQICSMMASIANNGLFVNPYLVEGFVSNEGKYTRIKHYSEKKQIMSELTAHKIQSFLLQVVENGSGRRAKSGIISCAGKTATAQTGKSINNEEIYNAWFAGYFPAENPKYAIVVMKENGGEGALSCAPVFKEISEEIAIMEQ